MAKEVMLFVLMIGIMIVGSLIKKPKIPMAVVLLIAAIVGSLAAGYGIPARILIEGTQQFFQLSLVVASGMLFMGLLKANGALDALAILIVKAFWKSKVLLLSFMMFLIMLPGMLTGSAPAAVLSTGLICVPIFKKLGIPEDNVGMIVAMGGLLGMIAPPINIPAMTIATGVYMPYAGFSGILIAITFPVAIFTVLFLGLKYVKTIDPAVILEGMQDAPKGKGFIIHIPMIFIIVVMSLSRVFQGKVPDIGTTAIFMLGAVIALFTGKKINILKACKESVYGAIDVLALFAIVGTLISVFAMNGVRGIMVYACMSATGILMYIALAILVPVLSGPLMPFGAAAVLGVPLVMAFSNLDAIMVTAGLTLLMGVGALMPPTAISGQFAKEVSGSKNYFKMIKVGIVPIVVTVIVGVLTIIFAEQLGQIF